MCAPSMPRPGTFEAGTLALAVVGTTATSAALAACAPITAPAIVILWAALVPWLLALERLRSAPGALAAGALMSAGFVLAIFPWFPQMVADYTGAPWPVGLGLLLVLAPVLEPQFLAFALARHVVTRAASPVPRWLGALVGAGAYVGAEWAFPKLFADTLGLGLYASPLLRQAADLAGTPGLTFAVVVGNECVLAMLRGAPRGRRMAAPALCLALVIAGLALYGTVRLGQLDRRETSSDVRVAMVQADIAHYDRLRADLGAFEAVRLILDAHFALSAEAIARHAPDLLLWPETVYPTTFGRPKSDEGAAFDREIEGFVADRGVPLVFGAYDADGGREFNVAVLLQPAAEGRPVAKAYRKTHLFPLTEYLPRPLDVDRIRRLVPWAGAWTPGIGPRVLDVGLPDGRRLRIAPHVCYDALDPSFTIAAVRQGAEVLVTLSNDSWFAFPGVQRLILVVSAFRSIETRRPQVRSTPTGISAVIDERGALRGVLGADARGVLAGAVRPSGDTWTLMLAWGDWFGPSALVASLLGLFVALVGRRAGGQRAGRSAPGTSSMRPGSPGGANSGGTMPSSGSATGLPVPSTNS